MGRVSTACVQDRSNSNNYHFYTCNVIVNFRGKYFTLSNNYLTCQFTLTLTDKIVKFYLQIRIKFSIIGIIIIKQDCYQQTKGVYNAESFSYYTTLLTKIKTMRIFMKTDALKFITLNDFHSYIVVMRICVPQNLYW